MCHLHQSSAIRSCLALPALPLPPPSLQRWSNPAASNLPVTFSVSLTQATSLVYTALCLVTFIQLEDINWADDTFQRGNLLISFCLFQRCAGPGGL